LAFSGAAMAQEGARSHTLLPQLPNHGIKQALVLFHKSKTARFQNGRKALGGDVPPTKGDDLAQVACQIGTQIFIAQPQHVRVVAVPPPTLDMGEPRPPFHLAAQEDIEELVKGSLEAQMTAVEVVIRYRHVLAVAG